MFYRFWLPFGYPEQNKTLSLQTRETKGKNKPIEIWQQRKK